MKTPMTDEQLEELGYRFVDVNGDLGVGHLVVERDRLRDENAKFRKENKQLRRELRWRLVVGGKSVAEEG